MGGWTNFILLFVYYLSYILLVNGELTIPIATIFKLSSSGSGTRTPAITVLNKIPNSETILNLNERVLFRCTSSYPIQWIYLGNGAPDYITSTSTEKISNLYQVDLIIEKSMEKHTGKYKCQGIEYTDISTYYYLYVPGSELFTGIKGNDILFSHDDTFIIIPCTVSQKDTIVSLHKSVEDVLQEPIPALYNSKIGFRLKILDLEDPSGIYVCSGSYKNNFRLIEYTVMPKDSVNRINVQSCTPSPCGKNTKCRLLSNIVTCSCIENFYGDPYKFCEKTCSQNLDCPNDLFCNSTIKTCEDPCKIYSCDYKISDCKVMSHSPSCIQKTRVRQEPCGKKQNCPSGTQCNLINGQYKCICAQDFLGSNPEIGCYASCQNNNDCSSVKSCDYPTCINPCLKFNPCGMNTNCIVKGHNRICECKEGYTGQPYQQMCHQIEQMNNNSNENGNGNSTPANMCNICGPRSLCNLINGRITCTCKQGYLGQAPNCRPSCNSNEYCPSKASCIKGRCIDPCGENQLCGKNSVCTVENHQPICSCIKGFQGNPYETCSSGSEIIFVPNPEFSPRCATGRCNPKRPSISIRANLPILTSVA